MIEKKSLAFNPEFYETATEKQIKDDIISFLGEYRFETPEFNYSLGFKAGKLTDPNSSELMSEKAKKAVITRQGKGLSIEREKAEFEGLINLEKQLVNNPKGTVVWFSPPGRKEDGYGDYGFGYVGKLKDSKLEMTAIRLENPKTADFIETSIALFGKKIESAEEFLKTPMVINADKQIVREFIHGVFEIKDEKNKLLFEKAMGKLSIAINDAARTVKNGSQQAKHLAMHVIENLAIEVKNTYFKQQLDNVIFLDFKIPDFSDAMLISKYIKAPSGVSGSCGFSGDRKSSDIFKNFSTINFSSKERDFGFDQPGPCRLCGEDVPCGPCKICEPCNDKIDQGEMMEQEA